MQTTAAIPAGVYHNAFLADVFAKYFSIHFTETVVAHALYVHIAKTTARQSVNLCLARFHPTVVQQVAHLTGAYRQNHLFPGFSSWHRQAYKRFLAGYGVEHCRIVHVLVYTHTVNRCNDST